MRTLFFTIIILIAAAVSDADTIVQKEFFNNFTGSLPLSFEKFDSTKGTLASIEINFDLTITNGTIIIDNDSEEDILANLEFGTTATIQSADVSLAGATTLNRTFYSESFELDENTGDTTGDYDPSEPDGVQYQGSSKNQNVSGFINTTAFADYTGSEYYDITVSTSPWIDITPFNDIEYYKSEPITNNGYVEVIYTYQPVPEPATILLLTSGVVAIIRQKHRI